MRECGCFRRDDQESAANPDAETIVVGTGNGYQPFVYLGENGELEGYDVVVLKAVDKKLDQYNFEYESSDFKNILTSLQAGKVDLAAHQYQYNDERAEKYLFGEVGYNNITLHIISIEGEGEYNSLDDLQGKNVIATPGANEAHVVEEYNSEHGEDEQINIVYNEGGSEIFISSLQNGTADAGVKKIYDGNKYNEQFNANLAISEQPVSGSKANSLYRKGDEALQQAVDGAVQELIDEGTLAELSIEYLGDDYTQ